MKTHTARQLRHFITTQDWSLDELQSMVETARQLKSQPFQETLRHKSVALLFFNSSMRTRTSFQIGVHQLGGFAVVLQPGQDAWPIEFETGKVMDEDAEEHISEVAQVLSRYCDLIAIRAFPKFRDWSVDRTDHVIRALARQATVPVINMETITHPCQEMAHIMALQEHLGELAGRKYLLTWTWHPKPLNTAVANSALLIATRFGMDVTLLIPEEAYLLDEQYMQAAAANAAQQGRRLTVTCDMQQAYADAEVVYCKSWGALPCYGDPAAEWELRKNYRHFIVDGPKMARTRQALFSHCLPLRRNVKATDEVMNADYCIAVDEAENRLHAQKAIMTHLIRQ
jgi:N-acetylornithine carbamoyltransferase